MGFCSLGGVIAKQDLLKGFAGVVCAPDGSFHVSSNEGKVIKLLLCVCDSPSVTLELLTGCAGTGAGAGFVGQEQKGKKIAFGMIIILALLMYQCQVLSFAAS